MTSAAVLGGALVLAALLYGGVYHSQPGGAGTYVVNRLTGTVAWCDGARVCTPVPWRDR